MIKRFALTAFAACLPLSPVVAEDLTQYEWLNRPVVIFADTPEDPRFVRQMALLEENPDALAERDVVVLTDTDPAVQSDLRTRLRPRGFMLVLIGKDGTVKLRKPRPWSVREISRVIDKMPMRIEEIGRAKVSG